MNPNNQADLKSLSKAMTFSKKQLRDFRETRVNIIRQYVGKHYGKNGASDRVPINMIELAVNTFQRQIAARSPQVIVNTDHRELLAGAADLRLATNYLIKKIDLESTIRAVGVDALLGMGVVKIGLDLDGLPAEESGFLCDPGAPFVRPVYFEDWMMDMNAREWPEITYCGNRYRVPLEWAQENWAFDKDARESLAAREKSHPIDEGDSDPSQLSRGNSMFFEEYKPHCELWDIWLPQEGLLVTLPDGEDQKPLRIVEWDGPESGPYKILGFGHVPGNIIPLAPAHMWLDLHELINTLFCKAARQAERQKTILGVASSAVDDGKKIVDSGDGEVISMNDPNAAREYKFGGADQATTGMVVYLRDMFSYLAGNLDSIGGLGASTSTYGQDRLLANSSSQRVQDMQQKSTRFVKEIVTDLAWYLWTDPNVDLPLTKPIQGTNLSIPFRFTPERRMGELFQYNFDIEPYSMTDKSPQERLMSMMPIIGQMLIPMMQQAGMVFDVEGFIKLVADYGNFPELNRLVIYPQGEHDPGKGPVMPSLQMGGPKEYIRYNVPAGSRQGKDQALAAHMFGLAQQPSEMAATMRPGG